MLLVYVIGLVVGVQGALDAHAVTAVETHLGHNLEILAHVNVEMREEIGLGHFHHHFVGAALGGAGPGLGVGLELVALVVELPAKLQAHVGEQPEHGKVAHDRKAHHRAGPLRGGVAVGVEETHLEGSSAVRAHQPVVVGRCNLDVHAVQVGGGDAVGEGEELLVQVYLGPGREGGRKKGREKEDSFHRNSSSMSTFHTISAFSSTLIRNLSFTL